MIRASYRIKHELPRRLRIQVPVLVDPSFDKAYFEASLGTIKGVERIRINRKSASLVIAYDGSPETRRTILDSFTRVSDECFKSEHPQTSAIGAADIGIRLLTSLATSYLPQRLRVPLSWLMATPVLSEGLLTTLNQGIKVETLDATAVGLSLLRKEYFTASMISALLSLGRYLEQMTEAQTTSLLQSLLRPQIEVIWIERDGAEVQISMDQVKPGDLVICGSGEMVPVDGKIDSGEASLNQSSISGEAVPVHVQPGDDVLSGSLIEEGKIVIRAEKVGRESTVARISSFLVNSLRSKSPVQKQSDELADSLVPITFALGLAIQLITRDIKRTAAVFTVDYSCAIKLASPIAVKMAMFHAARNGVLLKGAAAIDLLSRVDTIVFDKTGTLTKGRMAVSDVYPVGDGSPDQLLAIAAAAEEHYSHPVAAAVVRAARERDLALPPLSQVDFIVAHGVSAYVDGKRVLVGSYHFIAEDEGVECSAVDGIVSEMLNQGKSPLYVAEEGRLSGVIALADEIRLEAQDVLLRLKDAGIENVVVLSGDHRDVVQSLGRQLGLIDELHWELKPEDKAEIVRRMTEEGRCIAFAGDGVNDSPALLTADVGVCMPNGADLARESAQVVLLHDSLEALAVAREIAVHTQRMIKNCFKASVGINSLLLMLATSGRLPPVISALLHNLSTIGVLSYAAAGHTFKSYENNSGTEPEPA